MVMRKFILREKVGFTSSIEEQPLAIAAGTYIHDFYLGIKADLATGATVAIETFADLINPFQYRVNGVPRISLSGRDIAAFDILYFGYVPRLIQGAAGEDDKIFGLKVPIGHVVKPNEAVSWLATRVAVTNVSGEIISVAYTTREAGKYSGAFDIRSLAGTTGASTGKATLVPDLPRVGKLIGIMLFSATVPTSTADTVTLSKIELYRNDVLEYSADWFELMGDGQNAVDVALTQPARNLIENYALLDLKDDPWDLTKDRARLDATVGVANSGYKIIPIYQI
jgi:hypothetical protein